MIVFNISYSSDKSTHSFSELKKFIKLINELDFERFSVEIESIRKDDFQNAPDYSCVQNHCWHLPSKYLYTCQLNIQVTSLNDTLKYLNVFQNFCSLLDYNCEALFL
ncbi:hypothetical protein [Flavobacterium covae]|uniref:hypothetical protein n=1 Tax=Flavobacterium covae TaxID=2906076 RepID=UPI0035E44C41